MSILRKIFILICVLRIVSNSLATEELRLDRYYLAPSSIFKVENPLFNQRTNQSLSEMFDLKRLNDISDQYIDHIDQLIAKKEDAPVTIKVLYHDDADGVVSAKMVEAFAKSYSASTGTQINLQYETRGPRDQHVGDLEGIDAVFAVDLFWSQQVEGIDFAIDHHPLEAKEKVNVAKNKKLVNLEEAGFKGDQVKDSKYMPASAFTAILLDYVLKRKGVEKGLLESNSQEYLNGLLDGGIRGDHSEPTKEAPEKGFKVLNEEAADAVSFVSSVGKQGLQYILNKSLDQIKETAGKIRPKSNQKLEKARKEYQSIKDTNVAGIYIKAEDYEFSVEGIDVDPSVDILGQCSALEKSEKSLNERRVVAMGKIDAKKGILKMSLRFDGPKDIYSLDHIHDRLKNPTTEDNWDAKYFQEGGGPAGAKSIRIALDLVEGDPQEFFQNTILPAVSSAVAKIKTEKLQPAKTADQVSHSS